FTLGAAHALSQSIGPVDGKTPVALHCFSGAILGVYGLDAERIERLGIECGQISDWLAGAEPLPWVSTSSSGHFGVPFRERCSPGYVPAGLSGIAHDYFQGTATIGGLSLRCRRLVAAPMEAVQPSGSMRQTIAGPGPAFADENAIIEGAVEY